MGVEVAAGILAHSVALLADAGHCSPTLPRSPPRSPPLRLQRVPRAGVTFGLGRAEILAAQGNGHAAPRHARIVYSSCAAWYRRRRARRHRVAVALAGVAVNLAATLPPLRADRSSLNVRGAFLHVATDLAAFVGTAIAGSLVLATGWSRFDPIASLLVAALMLRSSWSLIRDSGRIFLEAAPTGIDPDAVAATLAEDADVVEVHDLHVWTVTSGFPALAAHVLVSPEPDCHAARRRLEQLLAERFGLRHTTLQVDHVARRSQPLASSAVNLNGKTAIVTGASSGFGRSTARMLAEPQACVSPGARAARTARDGGRARARRHAIQASSERFVAVAVEQLGGIDILINNAGLALGRAPFETPVRRTSARSSRRSAWARAHDTACPSAHPRPRAHRQPRVDRGATGVRERSELHRLEIRRTWIHVCAARGPARPPDPHHHGRPRARGDGVLRRSLQRATRRRRTRSTRASTR